MPRKKTKTTTKRKPRQTAKKTTKKTIPKKTKVKKAVKRGRPKSKKITPRKKITRKTTARKAKTTPKRKVVNKKKVTKAKVKKNTTRKNPKSEVKKIEVREEKLVSTQLENEIQPVEIPPKQELMPADLYFSFEEDEQKVEQVVQPANQGVNLTHRQKNVIMYAAIGGIMVVLVSFWFVGIKNSLGNSINIDQEPENNSVEQASESLKDKFNKLHDDLQVFPGNFMGDEVIDNAQQQIEQEIIEKKLLEDVANKLDQQFKDLNNQPTN